MKFSDAFREILWNISFPLLMYFLFFVALAIFGIGLYRRILSWKQGKPDKERFSHLARRLWSMTGSIMFQKKVFHRAYPGIFHAMIFYSFIFLVMTTLAVLIDHDLGIPVFKGSAYVFFTLFADTAGGLILIGIGLALWRRIMVRPETLDTGLTDLLWPLFLALIVISGFTVEALRIIATDDPWSHLSPVGYWLSFLMSRWMNPGLAKTAHRVAWWGHAFISFAWIAMIPYTKFFHMAVLPVNAFFVKGKPIGELSRTDIVSLMENEVSDEAQINIGIGSTADFSWKQRLDLEACVLCGRCDSVCPARRAGQPLSPKNFILNMKALLQKKKSNPEEMNDPDTTEQTIVGNAFDENFIWLCRTCLACVEACPAFIEHVDTFIESRRNEVLIQGRLPQHASRMLKTMESLGNPFGPQSEKTKRQQELGAPVIGPGESCDVLYWVGCFASLDPSRRKIATDLCRVLKSCEMDFGILGEGERCCGDPARIIGEEFMFQTLAREQVLEINQRQFNTLLVSCPHGYTVLKNEYPQFGGNYPVVHYTEFLYEVMAGKRKKLHRGKNRVVAYHDPCYLGRYQNIYTAPRKLLDLLPGIERREMRDNRNDSMCCGGGGGHFWMDFQLSGRIGQLRVEQAISVGADTLATACPFCQHMLEDAVKMMDAEKKICVMDIGAVLLEALEV